MDLLANIAKALVDKARGYAKDAGAACDVGACDALTAGVRCDKCLRRICVGHTLWNVSTAGAAPFCPHCVFHLYKDLFRDVEVVPPVAGEER